MRIYNLLTILVTASVLAASSAFADQSLLSSPTTGTVSGLTLTQNYNGALNALASCNSGASAPANTVSGTPIAGQCWLNTASSRYKLEIYDGSTWVVQASLDPVTHLWLPIVGGGVASLVSASTVDLGSVAETYLTLTGATAITSFGSSVQAGTLKVIAAASSGLVLTYNASSLILPGAANITMSAGDTAVIVSLGSGNWKVIDYQLATAPPNLRQVGTSANNLVALDTNAKLPAVDGSQLTGISTAGRLLRAPRFLTSGTSYTTPAGCTLVIIEGVGGGGGGGSGSNGQATDSGGGGGGGGAYFRKYATVTPNTVYTITIGAAGAGSGSGAGNSGGSGGATTIIISGVTYSAGGGAGGGGGYNPAPAAAIGGTATNGDINISGGTAAKPYYDSTTTTQVATDGADGAGLYAPSGNGNASAGAAYATSATSYGAGGGGGKNNRLQGGNGYQGYMIIWEFAL